MVIRLRTALPILTLIACTTGPALALPPFTLSRLYYANGTGQTIPGIGLINYDFRPSSGSTVGGHPFWGYSINNSGASSVLVGVYAGPGLNYAVLNSATGLNAFLAAGSEGSLGDPGSVTVPSTDYVYDRGFWNSINNNGDMAFSLGLRTSTFANVSPITGTYFNKSAMPVKAGDPVTAPGVAAGTTFGNFSAAGMVKLNDSNIMMIAGPIVEGGVTKKAIIKASLNGAGALVSETLAAKEGGPVGSGPDTWSSISVAPATCAMNNSGSVMFSGITTGGTNGIYVNHQFVATRGGAAPGAQVWDSLFAVPLDLSNTGQFAFRGPLSSGGLWTETGDAGEGFGNLNGGGPAFTSQFSTGSGSLNQINGSLSNDQDVDLYVIRIGDPNAAVQTPFSATTVPNPGAGFAGANFDTVLYLFEWQYNVNGNTRAGLGRCDDAAPGVMQSTLTTASLSANHTVGRSYILGVSTPKARAGATSIYGTPPPTMEEWLPEPGRIAIGNGMIFWADASSGQIGRSSLSSATLLPPLTVTTPPAQANETQSSDPNNVVLGDMVAAYDAGASSKVFYFHSSYATQTIQSCNTDGTGITVVIDAASGLPNAGGTSALAVDSVNGNLYWANPPQSGALFCRISTSDLTGAVKSTLVTLANTDIVTALAVDPTPTAGPGTGTLYWYNSVTGVIQKSDLTGANIQTVLAVAGLTSMTIDPTGRRLYYSTNSGNAIGAINIDTSTALSNLAAPTAPVGIAFDSAAGNVYWSTPLTRLLQRSSVSSPSIQNWTSAGPDVGERPAYGPGAFSGFAGWFRNGTAGSTALPYSIKLTGAICYNAKAMICRNNTISVDQALFGTSPGTTYGPVKVSDRGVVAWESGVGLKVDQTTVVPGTGNVIVGGANVGNPLTNNPIDIAMSNNGQHLLVQTYNGSQFGASQSLVQVDFTTVPGCAADFNGVGGLSVQDIFDFLGAWFAGLPQADFNGINGLEVQDIFDFLAAWFAGC